MARDRDRWDRYGLEVPITDCWQSIGDESLACEKINQENGNPLSGSLRIVCPAGDHCRVIERPFSQYQVFWRFEAQ
jgi:hypothetical protein